MILVINKVDRLDAPLDRSTTRSYEPSLDLDADRRQVELPDRLREREGRVGGVAQGEPRHRLGRLST